ncbi:MAG: hypothetical protein QOK38_1987 [Acidobacteriaceae bacterium]|jgi:uncharacterized protein YdhG (YjbR/CyaY superfamily)|nr:hypothetical protein [Acidobacteriaceae bacterium]
MPRAEFKSVDEYIAAQPAASQVALGRVRCAIRAAAWGAEEGISYKIPAYTLHGTVVLYFAGWKQHYSIYPADDRLVAAFDGELEQYRASKGTLRFPLSVPVPVKLIERIARYRVKEIAERKRAKTMAPKKR